MVGIVYRLTNCTNGKVYIGQTTTSLAKRMSCHVSMAKSGRWPDNPLYKAILADGPENFHIESIIEVPHKGPISEYETKAIEDHKSHLPEFGYNVFRTRNSGVSSEYSRKLSKARHRGEAHHYFGVGPKKALKASADARRGKPMPTEQRMKIAQSLTGHPVSEETRRKICASNPLSAAVVDLETGRTHPSIAEASRQSGCAATFIQRECRGLHKKPRKRRFIFA